MLRLIYGREGSAPSLVQSELGLFFCDNDGTRDLPERGFERYGLFTSPDKTRRKITIHKLHQNPLFS